MPTRRPRTELADVGEFGFLADLLPKLASNDPDIAIGVGDDAAVVSRPRGSIVLTTDALVEGVHFKPGWLPAFRLGRRAFLVNASDIAAMGAVPRWCLVSLGAPARTPKRDLTRLMLGLDAAAREHGASIVGGNLARSPSLFVSVSVIGTLADADLAARRSGARPGDLLVVSGELGGAAQAVRQLRNGERLAARSRLLCAYAEPPARVELGHRLARSGCVTAMIDVSDGLLQDLGHICAGSDVGAEIDIAKIPVFRSKAAKLSAAARRTLALTGGEDYELLFAIRPDRVHMLDAISRSTGCRLTAIGHCTAAPGIRLAGGQIPANAVHPGHDHYRPATKRLRRPSAKGTRKHGS